MGDDKLADLLDRLFDNSDYEDDNLIVLELPGGRDLFCACCTYNFSSYNGG